MKCSLSSLLKCHTYIILTRVFRKLIKLQSVCCTFIQVQMEPRTLDSSKVLIAQKLELNFQYECIELFLWRLLTEPQLSKVATSDLLSNSEIWTDHRHCLAGYTRTLTGTVAGPFTDAAGWDFPRWFRMHLMLLSILISALSRLRRHCLQPDIRITFTRILPQYSIQVFSHGDLCSNAGIRLNAVIKGSRAPFL